VRERCEREGTPHCRFEIAVTRDGADPQKS
jgi:hypothetical protein